MVIHMQKYFGDYAQNKDIAEKIRQEQIEPLFLKPSQYKDEKIILDFSGVNAGTQSCMHALFSSVVKNEKEKALRKIEFKNVEKNGGLREVIQMVVEYSF
ncbi:MAG: DUF4325 domain-containing protein [Candidatus Peregrinibacteria bacterium]